VSAVRIALSVLILLVAVLPVTLHASSPPDAGHHATLRHAPRTTPASARPSIVPGVDSILIVVLPTLGLLAPPDDAGRIVCALAAPFVPPRA
jgi:hypothetical protein